MESQETQSLHSQNAVFRIALGANILSWLILVFYLLNFAGDIVSISQNWAAFLAQIPADIFQQVLTWASLLSKLLFGAFYFFILQGISQLLYVGLDIYLDLTDSGEEIEK
ncbi:MAG: hypothetical protein RBS68_01530 [Anaerolineales bacterium]|jgi:hypothetical protein|nr:hypothetical protein [Anaerolineales bacterium]